MLAFAVTLFVCLILLSLLTFRSIIHPSNCFVGFWAFLSVGGIFVFPSMLGGVSSLYVFTCAFFFYLGCVAFNDFSIGVGQGVVELRRVLFISICNLIFAIMVVVDHLQRDFLGVLLNISGVSREMSIGRYHHGLVVPVEYFIAISISYSALLSVPAGRLSARIGVVVNVVNVLVILFLSAILTTKLNILIALMILLFSSLVVAHKQGRAIFSARIAALVGGALLLVYTIFVVYSMLRYGWTSIDQVEGINQKLMNYAFGQMVAFDSWFIGADIPLFGAGAYHLFGVGGDSVAGVYDVYVKTFDGVESNVYTVFRGVLEDFGFLGGYTFWLLIGGVGTVTYNSLRRCGGVWIGLFVIYLVFIVWGIVLSLFFYNVFKLAVALYIVIFLVLRGRTSKEAYV